MSIETSIPACAVVILAAGSSSRLGSPKQLLPYRGKSLLQHAIDEALQAAIGPVLVVLGSNADTIRAALHRSNVTFLVNDQWEEGMASSIRMGVNEVDQQTQIDSILLMVCDQPFVSARLLKTMVRKQQETGSGIIVCQYGESVGPPTIFTRSYFPGLLALQGDAGAKKIVLQDPENTSMVAFQQGEIDIDTRDAFESLVK